MPYIFADLTIDLPSRQVCRAEQTLSLQGLSFDLFAYLLQQGDRVVAVDELIEAVWTPAVVSEETVTQRIKLLRQALGDDSRQPRYLRTVRGRGYQLCEPPRLQSSLSAATVTDARRTRLGRAIGIIAVAAVLLLGALWWPRADQLPQAHSGSKVHSSTGSSAVDALLTRAQHYAAIGQRDDALRAIDLYQQVLALQPDSAAAKLGLSFASSAMMCLHNGPTTRAKQARVLAQEVLDANPQNSAAYAARAYAADCQGLIDTAIADYRQAVELDPDGRVDSLASLAHLLAVRGELAQALRANLEAKQRGQDLRLIDLQLAHNLQLLGYAAAAERLLQRSFTLYPDNAFIAAAWPAYLYRQGRTAQARVVMEQSMERPQHPSLWLLAAELALLEDDQQSAVQAYAAAVALKPESGPAESLLRIHSGPVDPDWAAQRLADLRAATEQGDRWPDNWLEIAQLDVATGQPAAALEALDQAVDAGYRDRLQLTQSPLWRELRDLPEFNTLLDRIATLVADQREQARAVPGLAELLAEGGKAETF